MTTYNRSQGDAARQRKGGQNKALAEATLPPSSIEALIEPREPYYSKARAIVLVGAPEREKPTSAQP